MPTKPSDLQVLRIVLALPKEKLGTHERTVFQRMYDDVAGGMVISLSKKQRAWVDGVYAKHDLDKPQNRGSEPVRVLDKARLVPPKKPYQETPEGKAQLQALQRAAESGAGSLIDALVPSVRKAIQAKATSSGKPYEEVALAFIRSIYPGMGKGGVA